MSDFQQLKEKKNMFVESVNKDIINGLLDDLLESGMITQEKMEELRDENVTMMDKALALIEYVIWKGPEACQLLIKSIWHRDPHLARKMNLPYSSEYGDSAEKFV
uniref:CARD domain-containing protein n=1 Tax=Monodelphis domestica TaxID=13616 RepID=A0A5F8H2R4_MONDO